jgi:hypothetical protein
MSTKSLHITDLPIKRIQASYLDDSSAPDIMVHSSLPCQYHAGITLVILPIPDTFLPILYTT